MSTPECTELMLRRGGRTLEVRYADGSAYQLPAELLRVYSPSAEVRGHGPGQEVLVTGKRDVAISAIEPVGHYAVALRFSDGHASGIYSFDYLHELAGRQEERWQRYVQRLAEAGKSREP